MSLEKELLEHLRDNGIGKCNITTNLLLSVIEFIQERDKVKLSLPVVMPQLLCKHNFNEISLTKGKKYKQIFEFDGYSILRNDKDEVIRCLTNAFEVIAQ